MSRKFYDYDAHRQRLEADMADAKNPEPTTEPEAVSPQPPLVVRPGSHWAAAAFKAGREDEYIDAMRNRYGDEW